MSHGSAPPGWAKPREVEGSLETANSVLLQLKRFGIGYNDRVVIRDATLNYSSASPLGLIGAPGSGKSTLLRALAGLRQHIPGMRTWGDALLKGKPISPDNAIDLVSQNAKLMMLSLVDYMLNSDEGPRLERFRKLAPASRHRVLQNLFESAGQPGLMDSLGKRVVELELADQRILALLRKTLERPALLALDEPTAGLDEAQRKRVIDAILAAQKMVPVLVVTHNSRDLTDLGAQQAIVDDGVVRMVTSGGKPGALSYPTLDQKEKRLASDATPVQMRYVAPKGFIWILPKVLAGMRRPGLFGDLDEELAALKNLGVRYIIGLEEQCTVDAEAMARHGLSYQHVPIPDMDVPLVEEMESIVDYIDTCSRKGGAVAVHCRAGLGRTGTALASYLIARKEMHYDQALEQIRKLEPLFVQTEEQIKFLAAWEEFWRRIGSATDLRGWKSESSD